MEPDSLRQCARLVCLAACLLAFTYKLPGAFAKRRDPALVALLVCFASETAGWALCIPGVATALEAFLGIPDIATLLLQGEGAALFGPALLIAISYWTKPIPEARRTARYIVVAAIVVASAMTWLWILMPRHDQPHYAGQNLHDPAGLAYTVVYETSFGLGLVSMMVLAWRHRATSNDRWLRRGLRIVVAGASCYLIVCAERLVSMAAVLSGFRPGNWAAVASWAAYPGIVGVLAGLLLPSLARDVALLRKWAIDYRAYRRLYGLWHDLCLEFPTISLLPPTRRYPVLRPGDLRYLLNRQVIEIRDGWRGLRPYTDPVSPAQDPGPDLPGEAAKQIRTALGRKSRGAAPHNDSQASPLERLDISDHEAEVSWLLHVADEYAKLTRSLQTASDQRQPQNEMTG